MDLSTVELDSNPGPASYMLWDFAQSSCSVAKTLLSLTHPALALFSPFHFYCEFSHLKLTLLWLKNTHKQYKNQFVYCTIKECYLRRYNYNLK